MEGRIDPPSSVHLLSEEALATRARDGEVWGIGDPLRAVAIFEPLPPVLYVGKLSVAEAHRGQNLARRLIDTAEARARALGLQRLQLKTRVELVENHRAFARMGFVEVARQAHPGYDRPTSITWERPVPPAPEEETA